MKTFLVLYFFEKTAGPFFERESFDFFKTEGGKDFAYAVKFGIEDTCKSKILTGFDPGDDIFAVRFEQMSEDLPTNYLNILVI